jgi:Uma2 family endonuclease
MGGLLPDALLKQWQNALADPALRQLPYRIETNKWGHIEMTPPASPRHMELATALVDALRDMLGGKAFTECAILTAGGVKVADVVWCSPAYLQRHRAALEAWNAALAAAPDLCIEVMSPVDVLQALEEKVSLYLAAGAREAWVVFRDLTITIYDAQGNRSESALGIAVQEVARRASALLA